jgi:hypothetical protein
MDHAQKNTLLEVATLAMELGLDLILQDQPSFQQTQPSTLGALTYKLVKLFAFLMDHARKSILSKVATPVMELGINSM